MADGGVDVLMITHARPRYTRLALERLLATCDETTRVWLWHNGDDSETLAAVEAFRDHPRVHRFHRSAENRRLREPTNWLWTNATGSYLGKVDDDCLMPDGWVETLRRAHEDVPELGALGCWRFLDEDYVPELAEARIQAFPGGHRVLRNCWVEGSGYLLKRACVDRLGPLRSGMSFPMYCKRLALAGWLHGWYVPFLRQEHMDDPRSPYYEDAGPRSLTAANLGIRSVEERARQIHSFALYCQTASLDPRDYVGWRPRTRRLLRRAVPRAAF